MATKETLALFSRDREIFAKNLFLFLKKKEKKSRKADVVTFFPCIRVFASREAAASLIFH